MTATPDPIDQIAGLTSDADAADVDKPETRAELKAVVRAFTTCAAVRALDLSGRTHIMVGSRFFQKDTSSTAADDGTEITVVLIDGAGNHWLAISEQVTGTQRKITAAGDVTLTDNDVDIIVIAKTVSAATNVYLPDASVRTKSIRIVDGKYDALTNNITILPKLASGQLIMGGANYVIDSSGASILLTPLADGTGWI